jgi:hypothetical protein
VAGGGVDEGPVGAVKGGVSLELRKLYPVLEDEFGSEHGMIRVIDESGDDYLFPVDYFVRVSLPLAVEKKLRKIA